VQAQVSSHTAVRSAAIEARLQSDQAYWNSHRGSLLGNALSFFGRTANRAGYSFIQAANSLYGLATDRQYGRDVQRQLGTVIMNPGLVVDGVSTAAAAWWRSPVEQKLEGAATTAFEVLASGGGLIIGRGIRGGLASGAGRVTNSAPARLTFQPSSGVILEATLGKTTTILGNYSQDMKAIVNELGNVKSTDFGPRTGGFNVLNVPDELYVTPKQFWADYNQPWLSNAVTRGDPILMATQPQFGPASRLFRLNDATGKLELSGFGKEYLYLRQSGMRYDPITKQMVRSP
jgi:hypothetical protein